jgi:hypothetical protein
MEVLQAYEYEGMVLRLTAYEPHTVEAESQAGQSDVRAPGAGTFEIGALDVKQEDEGLLLTARVAGRNLAYLYTDILLKDERADRFYGPVAREHIRADRDKEDGGVIRPDWEDPVKVRVRLRPGLRVLTDGVRSALCFAVPEGYSSPDHRVNGLYTLAGGEAPVRALLVFRGDGTLSRVTAHAAQGWRPGPGALTPKPGDRFAPFAQVLAPPARDGGWRVTTALADELAFGEEPLRMLFKEPLPGEYLVGLVAQDFDGGITRKYLPLRP